MKSVKRLWNCVKKVTIGWIKRLFWLNTHIHEIYKYPLRDDCWGKIKVELSFIVVPAIVVATVNTWLGQILSTSNVEHPVSLWTVWIWHVVILILLNILLWVPEILAVLNWSDRKENTIYFLRSAILFVFILFIFPHELLHWFLTNNSADFLPSFKLYYIFSILIVIGVYAVFLKRHYQRSPFLDIQLGKARSERKNLERSRVNEAIILMVVLVSGFFVEIWFLSVTANQNFHRNAVGSFFSCTSRELAEYKLYDKHLTEPVNKSAENSLNSSVLLWLNRSFFEIPHNAHLPNECYKVPGYLPENQKSAMIENRRLYLVTWFTAALFCAILLFLTALTANRLMKSVLLPVSFQERDLLGVLVKSHHYYWHFCRAMLMKYSFLLLGSLGITLLFLITPSLFIAVKHAEELKLIVQVDVVVLMFGISLAWISPIINAVTQPDITFGEYFNQRLSDYILRVQGHIGLLGFGNLGKRVLDREVRLLDEVHQQRKYNWRIKAIITRLRDRKKEEPKPFQRHFEEIVTPDLRLELLCRSAVVVERSPVDVLYASTNELLGHYGVVPALKATYRTKDQQDKVFFAEQRSLVPVLIGEANEAFVFSRGNLERAKLLISTVPDWESVQNIFEQANVHKVPAIICVSSSNQITYYTYRARHRQIVLVYPRHNQGDTLGFRLWAAIQKVQALRKMDKATWPKILIVGNNKSNQFMIETLWTLLTLSPKEKEQFIENNLRFIVLTNEGTGQYPLINDENTFNAFSKFLLGSYFAGSRLPFPLNELSTPTNPAIKVQLINDVDVAALEESLAEFRPDIMVVNHEEVDKSSLVLLRFIRALERLKTSNSGNENKDNNSFNLPVILLATARGDDRERQTLGDSSRFYDAISRMNNERLALDLRYPTNSYFDHFRREIHGETIIDSLSDAAEMIAGARRSFISRKGKNKETGENKDNNHFVESSACLPNTPQSLADYTARLARLTFEPPTKEDFHKYWQQTGSHTPYLPAFQYLRHMKLDDVDNVGFILNGYGTLVPTENNPGAFRSTKSESLVARIFVTDGRKYVEREVDPLEGYPQSLIESYEEDILQKISEPASPNVTDVLRRVAKKNSTDERNLTADFQEALLDEKNQGKYACPSMNICRIAAYQNFIAASNNLRLGKEKAIEQFVNTVSGNDPEKPEHGNEVNELWHARNYACCSDMLNPGYFPDLPQENAANARVFICCQNGDSPGQIAQVLNALLFRKIPRLRITYRVDDDMIAEFSRKQNASDIKTLKEKLTRSVSQLPGKTYVTENLFQFEMHIQKALGERLFRKYRQPLIDISQRKKDNWRINIDYFSHISCQNSHFALNRLFGVYLPKIDPKRDAVAGDKTLRLPLNVIRILPIGTAEAAEKWYNYARTLHHFLNSIDTEKDKTEAPGKKHPFIFYWMDNHRTRYKLGNKDFRDPDFQAANARNFPILIVIKRDSDRQKQDFNAKYKGKGIRPPVDEDLCRICYKHKRKYDCSKMRAWV